MVDRRVFLVVLAALGAVGIAALILGGDGTAATSGINTTVAPHVGI
jgi:predicted cobalt transporter CbtA